MTMDFGYHQQTNIEPNFNTAAAFYVLKFQLTFEFRLANCVLHI